MSDPKGKGKVRSRGSKAKPVASKDIRDMFADLDSKEQQKILNEVASLTRARRAKKTKQKPVKLKVKSAPTSRVLGTKPKPSAGVDPDVLLANVAGLVPSRGAIERLTQDRGKLGALRKLFLSVVGDEPRGLVELKARRKAMRPGRFEVQEQIKLKKALKKRSTTTGAIRKKTKKRGTKKK